MYSQGNWTQHLVDKVDIFRDFSLKTLDPKYCDVVHKDNIAILNNIV